MQNFVSNKQVSKDLSSSNDKNSRGKRRCETTLKNKNTLNTCSKNFFQGKCALEEI